MFKFIKAAKGGHNTVERQKLQKELFSYRRTLQHGFPHKPTAMAWDARLRLLCIGTATGAIKVFGRPGVEFYGQHSGGTTPPSSVIVKVTFLPGHGRVISLCDDNSLHLWEINRNSLVECKFQALEGKLKKISYICVEASGKALLLGTEGGNIYVLDVDTFTMAPDIIYQDVVMQNVPQDYKLNPGAVEAIEEQPLHPKRILIGYNRGLIVLWDRQEGVSLRTFIANQQVESLCWLADSKSFTSSHNDGSYIVWECLSDGEEGPTTTAANHMEATASEPITTYGPYPCRAIPKLVKTRQRDNKSVVIFSGGLPRSAGSDKYTVSVVCDGDGAAATPIAFDFTSKVIDFVVIHTAVEGGTGGPSKYEAEIAEALVVLAEEEIVMIDMQSTPPDWRTIPLPYLVSLHASAITCSHHVSGIPDELWEHLKEAGRHQQQQQLQQQTSGGGGVMISSRQGCPIDGGHLLHAKNVPPPNNCHEVLLTGHEDGTVRFWDATGVTMTPLYKFSTAQYFSDGDLADVTVNSDVDNTDADVQDDEDEWPPYRKVGVFDPYSDDLRLAVKRIQLCPLSGTLLVCGTAGHCVLARFDTEVLEKPLDTCTMNIVSDRDRFVWKGHKQLVGRVAAPMRQMRGFQARTILQVHPPAAITACALQADWGLVAVGTAHGLALYDYVRNKAVMVKCTLNPNDVSGSAGDAPISRRKSFKKSLRESFRRLRKGRQSVRRCGTSATPGNTNAPSNNNNNNNNPPIRKLLPPVGGGGGGSGDQLLEAKPVERQIEARTTDDAIGSFVRCLYFARTFLVNVQNTHPTLWAGTNNGTVYTFTMTVPPTGGVTGGSDVIQCAIAKEIQLKHRAPIIGIAVLDGANRPLPDALEVEKGVAPLPDATQAHRVIIASEEQFKIFTLPAVKPFCKYKLTAHEGARVRKMSFATFSCFTDGHLMGVASKTGEMSPPPPPPPLTANCNSSSNNNNSINSGDGGQQTPPTTLLQHQQQYYTEVDLLCLTNLGDCLVLSIPDLKRQLNAAAIKHEDINGISSLVFTKHAEAFYFHSSSELQRLSLAANKVTSARCYLNVTRGSSGTTTTSTNYNEVPPAAILQNGGGATNTTDDSSPSINGSSKLEENGNGTPLNLTVSSSVGDITIDSVRDYIGSNGSSNTNHTNGSDEFNKRVSQLSLSGLGVGSKTAPSNGTNGDSSSQQEGGGTSSAPTISGNTEGKVVENDNFGKLDDGLLLNEADSKIENNCFKAPLALAEELIDG